VKSRQQNREKRGKGGGQEGARGPGTHHGARSARKGRCGRARREEKASERQRIRRREKACVFQMTGGGKKLPQDVFLSAAKLAKKLERVKNNTKDVREEKGWNSMTSGTPLSG